MADSRRCTVCGRTLRDPASRARGTGPVCARNLKGLSRRMRRQLLPVDDVPTGLYL
ncbi:DUF6011 domain-containing protein [Streptomyces sp. NPDC045714]|uniref:DUF6011 domain-containing protein n=1 Tax=Streptomyces sp. NPDC045714 TaxID=3154913 RepID=UPI0033D03796